MPTDTKRYSIFIYLGLALAAIFAFEQVRLNDFIGYDDPYNITQNTYINQGFTTKGIRWAFSNSLTGNATPLTWMSHMLDCSLFGLNPGLHHLMSLLLHIITAMLLFYILKKATNDFWPSAFVATLFAVHPLNVETIAWASTRTHILGALFWMLIIAAYLNYARSAGKSRYLVTIILFELGIMAKAVVVTLPLIMLALDYWPLGRFEKPPKLPGKSTKKTVFWILVKEKIPFLALAFISSATTFFLYKGGGLLWSLEKLSPFMRILNAITAYGRYIAKIIYPTKLAVLYPYQGNNLPLWQPAIALAVLAAITILVLASKKKRPCLVTGWLWFLIALLPVIGLIQTGLQAIADRYAYIPQIGIFIIIAWSAAESIEKKYLTKNAAAALAAIIILTLAVTSRTQVTCWKNSISIYEHTLSVTKDNYLIRHNYASALVGDDRLDEAELQFKEALRINTKYYRSAYSLASLYFQQGMLDKAIEWFRKTIELAPRHAHANYSLAMALMEKTDYPGAIKYFDAALEIRHIWPDAYYNMARAFYLAGKPDKTIEYCQTAVSIDPKHLAARLALAHTLAEKGLFAPALNQYYYALKLEPDRIYTLKSLALILAGIDDTALKNPTAALDFAQHACQLTKYNDPKTLSVLAAAYSSLGQFENAIRNIQKALDLAEINRKDLAEELRAYLKMYKEGKPYRLQPDAFKTGMKTTDY